VYEVCDGTVVNWCISEQRADVCVCSPQVMTDHFTAPEVVYLETEVTIALVRFEQSRVCVCTKILSHTHMIATALSDRRRIVHKHTVLPVHRKPTTEYL